MKTAIAAFAASLALVTVGAPAAVATATPEPSGAAPPADAVAPGSSSGQDTLSTRLVDLESGTLDPSSRLSVTVTATNRSTAAVEDVVLELALTEEPLASRDALTAFLDDPGSFGTRVAAQEPEPPVETATETSEEVGGEATPGNDGAAQVDVDDEPEPEGVAIAGGASRTITIGASPNELDLPDDRWGVYGVVLTLRTEDGPLFVDAVPLTWQGADIPALNLATVSTATGTSSRVGTLLGAANVPGVTSAVDPATVTNARAFETGLVSRETWRLASGSPDLTSLAHAGDTTLMNFALSLPAGTNIAAVSRAPWLAVPAVVDGASTAAAAELGAGATLALPHAPGYPEVAEAAEGAVAQVGDALVIVPDEGLSDSIARYRPGTEAAEARALAESALLAAEADGDAVLLALDETWLSGSSAPSAVLETLMAAPWVEPLTLSALLETEPTTVGLAETLDAELDMPAASIAALTDELATLSALSKAATDPTTALADWGSDLLQAANVSLRSDPGVRDAAVGAALTRSASTLASLRIAESSDLNLLAESGEIPITVVNGLDHEVSVNVDLTSFSPNLQVLSTPTVTVPAGQEIAALVPVEAVSSANVRVAVVLRGPDGVVASEAQNFAVRVRADWGNAATAVFSVLLVLLLVAGLVRTLRRGRKDTRGEPRPAPVLAPDREHENVPQDEEPADAPSTAASADGPEEPDQADGPDTAPKAGRD